MKNEDMVKPMCLSRDYKFTYITIICHLILPMLNFHVLILMLQVMALW
jgi:hypothetical protein